MIEEVVAFFSDFSTLLEPEYQVDPQMKIPVKLSSAVRMQKHVPFKTFNDWSGHQENKLKLKLKFMNF